MDELLSRYEHVKLRIKSAKEQAGTQNSPTLLAVSKKQGVEKIKQLATFGQFDFGESYVQEAVEKIHHTDGLNLIWHFIGPIQSNKARLIAENFAWVHSVDRLKVLKKLSQFRVDGQQPLNVLLQMKIGGEQSKSGASHDELLILAAEAQKLAHIKLRGLMCIPPASDDFDVQCKYFQTAKLVFDELVGQYSDIDTLSMGMSTDLKAAIVTGSTLVRVGTDIFGPRADN